MNLFLFMILIVYIGYQTYLVVNQNKEILDNQERIMKHLGIKEE